MTIFDGRFIPENTPSTGDTYLFSGTVRKFSSDPNVLSILSDHIGHGEYPFTRENVGRLHEGADLDDGDEELHVTLETPDVTVASNWLDITFDWDPIPNATGYELELNQVNRGEISDTQASFLNLTPGFYTLKVRARGPNNTASLWSGGSGALAQEAPPFEYPVISNLDPTKIDNEQALIGRWTLPVDFTVTGEHLASVTGMYIKNDDTGESFPITSTTVNDNLIQGTMPPRNDITIPPNGDNISPYYSVVFSISNETEVNPAYMVYELFPIEITDRTADDQARRNFSTDFFFEGTRLEDIKSIYIGNGNISDAATVYYKVPTPTITDSRIDFTVPAESQLLNSMNAVVTDSNHEANFVFEMVNGTFQEAGFGYAWNKLD